MNFLEEVGNDNVPLSSKFATLFGSNMNEGLLKGTDGEFQFDFKGSGDAMASLIGLGKAIASGQLTTEQVQQIKESKVFEGEQKAEADTSKDELKGSGVAEDEKEKKTRRDLREEDIKEIYDLYAWDKNQEEWEEFLETDEGRKILDQIIAPYEIEIKAIAKGDVEVVSAAKGPIIRHIKAFNPEENNDLAGYIGGYLSRKVGSGRKTLEKGDPLTDQEYANHSDKVIEKFDYMIKNDGKIPPHLQTKKFAQRLIPKKWGDGGPNITATSLPDDYVHYSQPRVLTVREWARLQMFPDIYKFYGKKTTGGSRRAGNPRENNFDRELPKYTQIGNAVPVGLAQEIGKHFIKILN